MKLSQTALRTWLIWGGLGAAALLLVLVLLPVLTPFFVAAGLAYILLPSVAFLVSKGWPRTVAVVLLEGATLLLLVAVFFLLVPVLLHELPILRERLPLLLEAVDQGVLVHLREWGIAVSLDWAQVKAWVLEQFQANTQEWTQAALQSVRVGGGVLLAWIGNAILIPVVLFYLLMDGPVIWQRFCMLLPRAGAAHVEGFLQECDVMLGQYLRGQLRVMLALCVYYVLGLSLVGLDLALPVGVFTGLAVLVPYVGFGLGLLVALLVAALQFSTLTGVVAVAAVYGVGQLLESFVLTPRWVGERIGLPPLAVIFALLAFGQLFGFVGVLLALPCSAVLLVAWKRVRAVYLSSRLYEG